MENTQNKGALPVKTQKILHSVQIFIRVFVIASSLASTWIIVSSKEIAVVFGLPFAAKYTYSSSFRFFAYANACVCGLAVVSLFYALFAGRKGMSPNGFFFLFIGDLCMLLVAISACSAAAAEGNLGKYGNTHAGWLPICQYLNAYCDRVALSVAISFTTVLLLLASTILSAIRSRYNNIQA